MNISACYLRLDLFKLKFNETVPFKNFVNNCECTNNRILAKWKLQLNHGSRTKLIFTFKINFLWKITSQPFTAFLFLLRVWHRCRFTKSIPYLRDKIVLVSTSSWQTFFIVTASHLRGRLFVMQISWRLLLVNLNTNFNCFFQSYFCKPSKLFLLNLTLNNDWKVSKLSVFIKPVIVIKNENVVRLNKLLFVNTFKTNKLPYELLSQLDSRSNFKKYVTRYKVNVKHSIYSEYTEVLLKF